MSWVVMALRKQELKARISNLNYQLQQIYQESIELSEYSGAIADGKVGYDEMADMPSNYFGTAIGYNQSAYNVASQSAANKTNAYMQINGVTDVNVRNYMYNNTLESELEEYAKQETAKIQKMEKQLEAKKLKIETLLKAAESEYQKLEEAVDKNIESSAPKYV